MALNLYAYCKFMIKNPVIYAAIFRVHLLFSLNALKYKMSLGCIQGRMSVQHVNMVRQCNLQTLQYSTILYNIV